MDIEWAKRELSVFVALLTPGKAGGTELQIVAQAEIVERIADKVLPAWRTSASKYYDGHWDYLREVGQRCYVILSRREELEEKLGDAGPSLDAVRLHPWVWDSAKSLWNSDHYAESVRAAASSVNAFLQQKVGRRDASEGSLIAESFSIDAPRPGRPRLRLMLDDGSKTFRSLHSGVSSYGQGFYSAIRNPLSHEESELDEQEALEQLAALSVLARWIDRAVLLESNVAMPLASNPGTDLPSAEDGRRRRPPAGPALSS